MKPVSGWGGGQTQFFFELSPDRVLDAAEAAGFVCTGRCFALNSYENRVYEVELDGIEGPPIAGRRVIKFYRPGRWTSEQILEEHRFLLDLAENEIPVVTPLTFPDGSTLRKTDVGELLYSVFPKVGGRVPDELDVEQLEQLGRSLARIHNVGASRIAEHRIRLTPDTYGRTNLEFLLQNGWLPGDLSERYEKTVGEILRLAAPEFEKLKMIRIHGDCHMGNLLWDRTGPFFLDFDDTVTGPPVQDLWLLIPGRDEEGREALEAILSGYDVMREFDRTTLKLIEVLRALRFVHYTAWIARRWEDPAFPRAFPHFGTLQYWTEKTRDLEEQLGLIRKALS